MSGLAPSLCLFRICLPVERSFLTGCSPCRKLSGEDTVAAAKSGASSIKLVHMHSPKGIMTMNGDTLILSG